MPPSILIETLDNPLRYTTAQLFRAHEVVEVLGRRRLILCETPASDAPGRRPGDRS